MYRRRLLAVLTLYIAALSLLSVYPLEAFGQIGDPYSMTISLGHKPDAPTTQPAVRSNPQTELSIDQYVVKVDSKIASPFSGQTLGRGHGTAFVTEVDLGAGVVRLFTNRHVVECPGFQAQELTISVTNGDALPETAPAKVIYISPLIDFAELEVEISDLPLTIGKLHPVLMPSDDHTFFNFIANRRLIQRRVALAVGNPMSSDQIVSEGLITGAYFTIGEGAFIQTQAPINPGNSGGPLIDRETGLVLGMNTAMIKGANSIGFAIPIGTILQDHRFARAHPNYRYNKMPPVAVQLVPVASLERLGLLPLLRKQYPEILAKYDSLISIPDANGEGLDPNLFVSGDILLAVNGEVIGKDFFRYRQLIQQNEAVRVEVIRGNQIVTLEQNYPLERVRRIREGANFVLVSGLLFVQTSPRSVWSATGSGGIKSTVRLIGTALPEPEIAFSQLSIPSPMSVVVGINLNGKQYPIESLYNLKRALRENPNPQAMRLDVRSSIWETGEDGNSRPSFNSIGEPLLSPMTSTHVIPVTTVYTPGDFSLRRFIQQFGFDPQDRVSRSLERWIKKSARKRAKARSSSRLVPGTLNCETSLLPVVDVREGDNPTGSKI